VSLQGNNSVVGIDALNITAVATENTPGVTLTSPAVIAMDIGTGLAPQGVMLDRENDCGLRQGS